MDNPWADFYKTRRPHDGISVILAMLSEGLGYLMGLLLPVFNHKKAFFFSHFGHSIDYKLRFTPMLWEGPRRVSQ